jgi:hypothetical protein
MNIYAGSGGWIYLEGRQDMLTAVLGKWFTVVNQSYFMGLFMLIAAHFVPGSYDRRVLPASSRIAWCAWHPRHPQLDHPGSHLRCPGEL